MRRYRVRRVWRGQRRPNAAVGQIRGETVEFRHNLRRFFGVAQFPNGHILGYDGLFQRCA
ncbi:MAG: hypothetical protein LBI38_01945 [Oscillospiraceae bacterium]|nr:hypothetical protein [Oscillospiraceae bacterium]